MGRSKALLPFGDEVLLQRVVRRLVPMTQPIVVVAAADQELPDLSDQWLRSNQHVSGEAATGTASQSSSMVRIARDPVEYRGPLAGLAVGMIQLRGEVDAVYASACDAPLLKSEFVQAMVDALGDAEIAVPFDGRYHHPLAAVYRLSVLPVIEELLAADRLRPVFLFERCRTREVPLDELRRVDPELDSLCNTNTPEEYARALARAGVGAIAMSARPRPPYTHIPGVTPHPIRDPAGHSFGLHPSTTVNTAAADAALTWNHLHEHPEFQWAVTLFNAGYYWESHEAWESLWHLAGRKGVVADFLKGLIKLAAAGVKLREHNLAGVERHARRARELFQEVLASSPQGNLVSASMFLPVLIQISDQLVSQPVQLLDERTGRPVSALPRLPWPTDDPPLIVG